MPRMSIQTHTPESLAQVRKRLSELVMDLETLEAAMKNEGVESVEVLGHSKLIRGLPLVGEFVDNARQAYRERVHARDFWSQENVAKFKKAKKKRG